jgi:hypothetical protein
MAGEVTRFHEDSVENACLWWTMQGEELTTPDEARSYLEGQREFSGGWHPGGLREVLAEVVQFPGAEAGAGGAENRKQSA